MPIDDGTWEQHRVEITNLYITQKKTLPEVMGLMERENGFIAT